MAEKSTKPDVYHVDGQHHNGSDHDHKALAANKENANTAFNVIQNPLQVSCALIILGHSLTNQSVSREQAVYDAQEFAKANNLGEHADLFGRAALVARDPRDFESIDELTGDERVALQYERDHKWHGSRMLWYSIILCAVGAATQGESRASRVEGLA